MALPFDPERLLKAGIHALKQRQYSRALTSFEQLQASEVPKAIQIKATMGQVRVFLTQGKTAAAVELCEKLAKNNSRHVQAWAREQLQNIQVKPTDPGSPIGSRPARKGAAFGESDADTSGFQPLDDIADQSGFRPLDGSEVQPTASASEAKAAPPEKASPKSNEPDNVTPEEPAPSLFQYDALNQTVQGPSSARISPPGHPVSESTPPSPAVVVSAAASTPAPEPPTAPSTAPVVPVIEPIDEALLGWQPDTRLKTGRSLGKVKRWRLWFAQVGCALLAFGTLRYLLHASLRMFRGYLNMLDRILPLQIRPFRWLYPDYTWQLLAILLVLGVASPWLWDLWLRWRYQAKPYSTRELVKTSPEAVQLLRKVCMNRRWAFPPLRLLPTSIPLLFSYGWLPRYGRLVVSQGLLDQLEDDEIAALYAYELNHWRGPDWPLLSLVGLLLQVSLSGYWSLAQWGNRQERLVKVTAGGLSMACYGVFWLLNKAVTWVSRVRTYYRDRSATQLTGNPNGLSRAFGKLAFGLAESIAAQGFTPPLLESLSPLLPVSTASVLPLFAERRRQPLPRLFQWDALNPNRAWLSIAQVQPPLGDRLQLLMAYAQHWRLTPTLDFSSIALPRRESNRLSSKEWRQLIFQAGPWSGLAIGALVGVGLWGVGAIATSANVTFLDWLNQDYVIIKSTILLGLSVGLLLRMNAFFPDLPPQLPSTETEYPAWLTAPDLMPGDSLPVQLSGQLLGRPGIANWLGQDLLLNTPSGLVKLHFFSVFGPIGNSLGVGPKPCQQIGQMVRVTGWFRRGQQVWIDVQRLQGGEQRITGNHPVWSLVVFAISALLGLLILVRG